MKHFKSFLSVAFLASALTFTSCIKNNPIQSGYLWGKAKLGARLNYQFGVNQDKLTVIPTSQALITQANIKDGDIAYLTFSYNSDEQPLTAETKTLTVELTGLLNCGNTPAILNQGNGAGDPSYENASIVNIAKEQGIFAFYDKDILILPIHFLAKNDLGKHVFNLIYDESNVHPGDRELKLYLRHKSMEEGASTLSGTTKAFNFSKALAAFGQKAGAKPTKITILTTETKDTNSDKLQDAKEEPGSYSLDYKFDDK